MHLFLQPPCSPAILPFPLTLMSLLVLAGPPLFTRVVSCLTLGASMPRQYLTGASQALKSARRPGLFSNSQVLSIFKTSPGRLLIRLLPVHCNRKARTLVALTSSLMQVVPYLSRSSPPKILLFCSVTSSSAFINQCIHPSSFLKTSQQSGWCLPSSPSSLTRAR